MSKQRLTMAGLLKIKKWSLLNLKALPHQLSTLKNKKKSWNLK